MDVTRSPNGLVPRLFKISDMFLTKRFAKPNDN